MKHLFNQCKQQKTGGDKHRSNEQNKKTHNNYNK